VQIPFQNLLVDSGNCDCSDPIKVRERLLLILVEEKHSTLEVELVWELLSSDVNHTNGKPDQIFSYVKDCVGDKIIGCGFIRTDSLSDEQ
jgi:hypothetical protein